MVINISFVKPKNKLKNKIFKSDLCNEIVKRVLEFENHLSLKNDPELLKFICDLIENGVKKTDEKNKIDKKELVLEIYSKIFNINENEKKHIGEQIEFLCDNDLIVKVHSVKKNGKLFMNYIKSKLWKASKNKTNILLQFLQTFYSKSITKFLISKFGMSKMVVGIIFLIL